MTKLYVWNDLESLKQYSNGMAFAIADNKEEAIRVILERFFLTEDVEAELTITEQAGERPEDCDFVGCSTYHMLYKELKRKKPIICYEPTGFYWWGSQ